MHVEKFGRTTGIAISWAKGSRNPMALEIPRLQRAIKKHGLVLLRGFDFDVDRFARLASRMGTAALVDPGSSKMMPGTDGGEIVQRIRSEGGGGAQDPHQENGRGPCRPDLLWFYCARPAVEGGHTVFCDGAALWAALPARLRQLFTEKKIVYVTLWDQRWNGKDSKEMIHALDIEPGLFDYTGMSVHCIENGGILVKYATWAHTRSRLNRKIQTFTNSMFGPYSTLEITFEDGTRIPEAVLSQVKNAQKRMSEICELKSNDVLLLDNFRFMHGRTAFKDSGRGLYTAMTESKF